MCGQQEATRPTRGIADPLSWLGMHDIDNSMDQHAWRKILTRTALSVFSVLLQEPFVGIALDVRSKDRPGLSVNQVDNQAAQFSRVLDLILCLTKDNTQHPRLFTQLLISSKHNKKCKRRV